MAVLYNPMSGPINNSEDYTQRVRNLLMAPKKAKITLPPLFVDDHHSDEFPLSLSPLTPIPDDPVLTQRPTASSPKFWHRHAAQGFRLPNESVDALSGPVFTEGKSGYYSFFTRYLTACV
jgi:hypothetical protein